MDTNGHELAALVKRYGIAMGNACGWKAAVVMALSLEPKFRVPVSEVERFKTKMREHAKAAVAIRREILKRES